MDDRAAIRKCLMGDRDAFHHLVKSYQNQAIAHAVAILNNRQDASDAVQEALVDAFRSLEHFDQTRKFYPWFYVLLRNRCFKMTAKRRITEDIENAEILAPKMGLPLEEKFALERALRSLSFEDREIVTLKYLDGLSYDELAERLQIPRGTVMSRLFYARKQLQAKLTGKLR